MVTQGVGGASGIGYAEFSIPSNGTLLYGQGMLQRKRRFEWWDRSGKLLESVGQAVEVPFPDYSLSPDGSRVAFSAGRSPGDIWVMPFASGIATRLPLPAAAMRVGLLMASIFTTPMLEASTKERLMVPVRKSRL